MFKVENEFQRMGRKPREARQWEVSQSQTQEQHKEEAATEYLPPAHP